MVVIEGDEILNFIEESFKKIEEHREVCLDLLYNIGSILISIGLIKDIPVMVNIG